MKDTSCSRSIDPSDHCRARHGGELHQAQPARGGEEEEEGGREEKEAQVSPSAGKQTRLQRGPGDAPVSEYACACRYCGVTGRGQRAGQLFGCRWRGAAGSGEHQVLSVRHPSTRTAWLGAPGALFVVSAATEQPVFSGARSPPSDTPLPISSTDCSVPPAS